MNQKMQAKHGQKVEEASAVPGAGPEDSLGLRDGNARRQEDASLGAMPIKDHKRLCQEIAPPGYQYGGFDEGYYLFQTGNYRDGFRLMECLEEDLTRENLALMARMGLTRARTGR